MTHVRKSVVVVLAGMVTTFGAVQAQVGSAGEWQRMLELGEAHEMASGFYRALKEEAEAPAAPAAFNQLPDWSGLWTHTGSAALGLFWSSPDGTRPKLTSVGTAMQEEGVRLNAEGINYDENLSQCGPPGFPRWLIIPFLREFIVRPEQTWLTSETVNNVRRVYTDGRDHPPEVERYPLYYGDSIGFWDGQRLVIHTNQLMARQMGRNTLYQSEQMETVEIWENIDGDTIRAQAWLYDPTILEEPWYVEREYARVSNEDTSLRMRYWHCGENENNTVFQTEEGSTQYTEFTFTGDEDR